MAQHHQLDSLTPREREILSLIAEGESLPEIAQKLHRSLKTIESHRLSLGRKLGASNRVELARIAIAAGLVSIDAGPGGVGGALAGPKQELDWLTEIGEAVQGVTGRAYIDRLCMALTHVLGVRIAAVCIADTESGQGSRLAVAFSESGHIGEPFQYDPRGKAAQEAIDRGVCRITHDIASHYPDDPLIEEYNLQSYLGIRMDGQRGGSTGVLAIVHDKPLELADSMERIMRFFSDRTMAELELVQQSERADQLQRQIEQHAAAQQKSDTGDPPAEPSALPSGSAELAGDELAWLRHLNQAVCDVGGEAFLRRFCDAASLLPGIDLAAICTPDPYRPEGIDPYYRYVIAVSDKGKQLDPVRYHALNTPCKTILDNGACCFSEGIAKAYPNDAWLKQLKAESYIGIQLTNKHGQPIGGAGLIGKNPLPDVTAYRRVIEFFTPHLARALEGAIELDQLRSRFDQLKSQHAIPMQSTTTENTDTPTASALVRINRRLYTLAGAAFLRGMVDALCETFHLQYAAICALNTPRTSKQLKAVVYRDGERQADPLVYDATDSPCEVVLDRGLYCLPKDAARLYPNAAFLNEHKIEGFIGVRLPTASGDIAGLLWAIDTKPLDNTRALEQVMQYFAPRLGAELENFIKLETLLQEREWLENQLQRQS